MAGVFHGEFKSVMYDNASLVEICGRSCVILCVLECELVGSFRRVSGPKAALLIPAANLETDGKDIDVLMHNCIY